MTVDNSSHHGTEAFWGQIASCDHLVVIYHDDTAFLDSLALYVSTGIKAGESVLVIATPSHRCSLDFRLQASGIDIGAARAADLYIPLDARETLAKFIIDGVPDEQRFRHVVGDLMKRARRSGGRVRAFGEMVSLLWAEGRRDATIRLEQIWTRFCQEEPFALFCAYPRSGFTTDASAAIEEICAMHTKVVSLLPSRLSNARSGNVAV